MAASGDPWFTVGPGAQRKGKLIKISRNGAKCAVSGFTAASADHHSTSATSTVAG